MPTFITTGRFSAETVKSLMASPADRAPAIAKLVEAAGGKMLHYFITTGDTEFLLITEFDGVEEALSASMVAAASGSVTDMRTNRAWTSGEFKAVFEKGAAAAGAYSKPGG